MNRTTKAVLWAIPPIALLIVIPRVFVALVPAPDISRAENLLGISVAGLMNDLTIFGIALAALSGLQTWAYKWSVVKPVASASHMIVSYTLLLFLLGFGDPVTFGTANISLSPSALFGNVSGIGPLDVSVVSTFVALFVGVAVVLKTVQKSMKYFEDRQFHKLDLEAVPSQPQPPVQDGRIRSAKAYQPAS